MGMWKHQTRNVAHAHSLHSLYVCCMFVFLCFIYSQLTILAVPQCSDPTCSARSCGNNCDMCLQSSKHHCRGCLHVAREARRIYHAPGLQEAHSRSHRQEGDCGMLYGNLC